MMLAKVVGANSRIWNPTFQRLNVQLLGHFSGADHDMRVHPLP
jgi:hypothetical protein